MRLLGIAAFAAAIACAPALAIAQALAPEAEARVAAALGAEDYFEFHWFPSPDGAQALAIAYYPIPGAAGNFQIGAGVFALGGGKMTMSGPVEIYGTEPRGARFSADKIELVTTMPKPDDPRCCPTGSARWAIDRKTLKVVEN